MQSGFEIEGELDGRRNCALGQRKVVEAANSERTAV